SLILFLFMFSFFRKKNLRLPDFSGIGTDMHSHLLPGIDDGSPDAETSIALIRGMMDIGFKKFITTPHVMWDIYSNTNEIIQAANVVLQNEIKKAGLTVRLQPTAEYLLDDHIDQLLESNIPLLNLKE